MPAKLARCADGGLALRAAARRGRGRGALEQACARAGSATSPGRARSIGPRPSSASPQPAPKPPRAARPTALSVTDIETLAARSLHHLRQAHPPAARARSGRHAAGRRRPRHRHPRRGRRIHHRPSRQRLPDDPARELIATRPASISPRSRTIRKRARSGGRASSASRAGSPAGSRRGAAGIAALHAEIHGKIDIPLGERTFTLRARADRIERLRGRQLRHPRLQDRHGAEREAGAHRPFAAAHARSRDPARAADFPALPPAGRSPSWSTCRSRAATPAGEAEPIAFKDGATPTPTPTRALGKLHDGRDALRGRAAALPLARAVDVEEPLRQPTTTSRA